MAATVPTSERLRELFDATPPMTIGLEEELMLLDPVTLDLAPRSPRCSPARTAIRAS